MTQPAPVPDGLPPLFDTGNQMIAVTPCHMVTGKVDVPDGERGVLTIRNANTTLTVILAKADVVQWIETLGGLRDALSGAALVLPSPGDALRIANGQQR
jgi:hypothetical protein